MKIRLPLGDAFMTAVYAPSGRATCKGCSQKILKDELRLSNIMDEDHFHQELHYHADCFQLKKMFQNATYRDIFHVENLKKEDQEKVSQILEKLKQKGGSNKKQPQQKKPEKKDQKKKKNDSESSDDDDYDVKKDNAKKGTAKKDNAKKQQAKKQESDSSDDDNQGDGPDCFALYDDKQKEQYRKYEEELQKKTQAQLKEMLKINDQKQTGNKSELIERIADCKILGCLERCPNCSAGRPKFMAARKVFKCPGYMDDTEFRFCNKIYQKNELKRIPWKEI